MELQTVSTISKNFGISTRMLRYYEQIGLIGSQRKQDYSYRVYDEIAVRRLRQIILLRKLRVPVKQIKDILNNQEAMTVIDIFRQNINELDGEISALSTIRDILARFVEMLEQQAHIKVPIDFLSDSSVSNVIASLNLPKNYIKEEKSIVEDLNRAEERLNKLTDRDVRIVYLPPVTVAASHYIGDEPEHHASDMMNEFIAKTKLREIYPAARCYGFNHPNPDMREDGKYGYEFWITIPDDMDVPAPLEKKRFEGGLYAAYMILMDEIAGIGWERLFNGWLSGR